MLRQMTAWGALLSQVGNIRSQGEQLEAIFRYFVLTALDEEGFFEYLQTPRTYQQIIREFDFADGDYTHSVLNVLVEDRSPLLTLNEGRYQRCAETPLPELADIASKSVKHIRKFSLMAQGMAKNVLPRLRDEEIQFTDSFLQAGRELLTKFDMTLGSDVYTRLRNVAFAFLTQQDRDRLRGSQLLEVGCGNGRETAELWLRYRGDIHITAIDPVPSLLNLARQRFASYLDDMKPGHPPLTVANRPIFCQLNAMELPFDDHTFDVVLHAFVLHWIPDPARAVDEIARVLKPGGMVFGVQPIKPAAGPYFDLVVRTNDSYGFFCAEDLKAWYAEVGIPLEVVTPLGIFRGVKPNVNGHRKA